MGRPIDEILADQRAASAAVPADFGRVEALNAEARQAQAEAEAQAEAARRAARQPSMSAYDPNADPVLAQMGKYHQEPGSVASAARGFAKRAGEIGDFFAQTAYDLSLAPYPMDISENPGAAAAQWTGISPPREPHHKRMQMAGEWAADAVPFAPLAAASAPAAGVHPAIGVLAELGFSGLAGYTQEGVESQFGPWAGMLAAMPVAMSGPGVARVGKGAAAGVADIWKAGERSRIAAPAAQYRRELEVSNKALVGASEELKARVPDPAAYAERLRVAERWNDGSPGSVSSRQVADAMENDRGGSMLGQMEEGLSRSDMEYARKRALERANFLDDLGKKWADLGGGEEAADYFEFLSAYDSGAQALKLEERQAWRLVRQGEMPRFDVSDIQDDISRVAKELKFSDDAKAFPSVFRDLLNPKKFGTPDGELSSTLSLNELQEARSIMLGHMRDAAMSAQSDVVKRRRSALIKPVLDKIQTKIDAWASVDETGKSLEYLRAKQLTRDNKMLYDSNSPVIRVLEQGGQEKNLFTALRNAKGKGGNRITPADEASRLMRIAKQTPGGELNLRRMAIEDLFLSSDGFSPTKARTPENVLRQNEEAYRVVLGDDYETALELLDQAKVATRGAAGTANQAMRTGSNISPAQILFGMRESVTSPIPGKETAKAAQNILRKIMEEPSKNELMRERIMRTALEDPRFMRILMEMPTQASLPAWTIGWRQLLAASTKAGGRHGVREVTREFTDGD